MHLAKPFLLSIGTLAGAEALAAEDPFIGLRAGLGMSMGSSRHQIHTTPGYKTHGALFQSHTIWTANGTWQGFLTPTVDLSYGFPLSKRWIGTIGLRADLGSADAGKTQLSANRAYEDNATLKLKRHVSLYLQPGYRLNDNWQLYGSLSYHQVHAEYGSTLHKTRKDTLNGVGLGFGAEHAFGKKLSLRMELQSLGFGNYTMGYMASKADSDKIYEGEYGQVRANALLTYRF